MFINCYVGDTFLLNTALGIDFWPFGRASSCTETPAMRKGGPIRRARLGTCNSLPHPIASNAQQYFRPKINKIHGRFNKNNPFTKIGQKKMETGRVLCQTRSQSCTLATCIHCTQNWALGYQAPSTGEVQHLAAGQHIMALQVPQKGRPQS